MFPGRAHLGTWRDDFRSKIQVDLQNRGKWWKIPIQAWKMMENSNPSVENDGKLMNILINRRLKSALEGSVVSQATTLLEIFWSHMSPWPQNPSTQTGVFPPIDHFYCYYGDTTETMHDSHWMPSVSLKFCDHVPMEHMPIYSTSSIHEYIHDYWQTYPQFLSPHLQTAINQLFDCYPLVTRMDYGMTIKYHTIVLRDDHQWSSSSIIWLLWDD